MKFGLVLIGSVRGQLKVFIRYAILRLQPAEEKSPWALAHISHHSSLTKESLNVGELFGSVYFILFGAALD